MAASPSSSAHLYVCVYATPREKGLVYSRQSRQLMGDVSSCSAYCTDRATRSTSVYKPLLVHEEKIAPLLTRADRLSAIETAVNAGAVQKIQSWQDLKKCVSGQFFVIKFALLSLRCNDFLKRPSGAHLRMLFCTILSRLAHSTAYHLFPSILRVKLYWGSFA